jgi:hypothetical protein
MGELVQHEEPVVGMQRAGGPEGRRLRGRGRALQEEGLKSRRLLEAASLRRRRSSA